MGAYVQKLGVDTSGDLLIDVEGGSFVAEGRGALGMHADYRTEGNIDVNLRDTTFRATGPEAPRAFNVWGYGNGDLRVTANDIDAAATGEGSARGFNVALDENPGDALVDIQGGRIAAEGTAALALATFHHGAGDLHVDLRDVMVSAEGDSSRAVYFRHSTDGDVSLVAEGGRIVSAGEWAHGILGDFQGEGDIDIDLRDVAVSVEGESATGLFFQHEGAGDMNIRLRDTTVTADAEFAVGISALHLTGEGSMRLQVDGGTIGAGRSRGHAVQVGFFDEETGELHAVAEVGEDGYRRQSVMMNGRARGSAGDGAAGIWLVGGGRVEVGPRGSVGAASGTAILAQGEGAALHVGADFDGRRAGDVFDGAIVNANGRTTIAVNGVTLHDGVTGATGRWVPNGARDVTLAASEVVAGRTFTAADFVTGPHAPRAAVYEALPGVLQRLDGRPTQGERVRRPGSPAWARVSGGRGACGPKRASVGASYDFDRFAVEAGYDFGLSEAGEMTGSASLRHVWGSAQVSAPTGGGKIEAEGIGVSLGAAWRTDAGYHVDGRVTLARFEADLRSSARGRLKDGASATVHGLRLEAGRRLALGETVHLTPRAWLAHTDVSLDGFRDAVGSRVSRDDAERSDVGLGIVAETAHDWDDGRRTLSLRGELGWERTLGDAETAVDVSGERLRSESAGTRPVLGLGGTYRWGAYALGGAVSVSGPGSDDSAYTAGLRFGMRF